MSQKHKPGFRELQQANPRLHLEICRKGGLSGASGASQRLRDPEVQAKMRAGKEAKRTG